MRCGDIILCLRPNRPVWNGNTKICLHQIMWRLHLLQEKLWLALFGALKASLIQKFSDRMSKPQHNLFKTSYRPTESSLLFKMMRSITKKHVSLPKQCASAQSRSDSRNTGGNALGGTATLCLEHWPDVKQFSPVLSTQRGPRMQKIYSQWSITVNNNEQQWLDEQTETSFWKGHN
jgi:hypothetical protein